MYGSNRRQSYLPPEPQSRYENEVPDDEGEEEEDDLYEPPPCYVESRSTPCVWTPHTNDCVYLGRVACDPFQKKPPIAERSVQISSQLRSLPRQPAPKPPRKPAVPLPLPDRRVSLPCNVMRPPPQPCNNFPQGMDDLYLKLLDTQIRPRNGEATDNQEKSRKKPLDIGVMNKPWYGGEMVRKETEGILRRINKDGCFMVRLSTTKNQMQPYTLAVLYNGHIYNIPIRAVGNRGYSLGKEGKLHEEVFPSLVHLIEHYKYEQLYLVNRHTLERESTALLYPALL